MISSTSPPEPEIFQPAGFPHWLRSWGGVQVCETRCCLWGTVAWPVCGGLWQSLSVSVGNCGIACSGHRSLAISKCRAVNKPVSPPETRETCQAETGRKNTPRDTFFGKKKNPPYAANNFARKNWNNMRLQELLRS